MLEAIFGRDAELLRLDRLLDDLAAGPTALVVTGSAGAGKTTLFAEAIGRARDRRLQVLEARPSPGELSLAFAGLTDLVGACLADVRDRLPAPQRRALDVALLVEEAPAHAPEPRIIAAALGAVLRELADSAPVLVAIDDVQWLDSPTAGAVAFAFRRLQDEPLGLLCTQRGAGLPLELDRARLPAEELSLDGLSLGALHRMLRTRIDVAFSHPTLRRIEAESGGNPFIALEIGRALKRRGISRAGTGSPLPVPATLAGLVEERLGELPAPVTEVLRLVAAMPEASLDRVLAAGADAADLDRAVAAGVLSCDANTVRFSHPLLATAVTAATPPAALRRLHGQLAAEAVRGEERARHLALAADGPSMQTAGELDAAAAAAQVRGAPEAAAELFELAAALTPPERVDDRLRRRLRVGRSLAHAGETRAALQVFDEVISSAPPGPIRADALAQVGWYREDDFEASTRVLEQALSEVGDEPARRAEIHLFLSDIWAIRGDVPRARQEVRLALADARGGSDLPLLASTMGQAFWFDWMCGADADEDLLADALELEAAESGSQLRSPPSHLAGLYYMSVARLEDAEAAFGRALDRADANGEEYWRADTLLRLGIVAGLRGDLGRAERRVQHGLEVAEQLDLHQIESALACGCGLVALWRGRPDDARGLAQRGLDLSTATGDEVYVLCNSALLGAVDLTLGDHGLAADRLQPLIGRLPAIGRRPNTQFIAADAVEALAGAARVDEARQVLAAVEPRGRDPVAALLAARSRGHIAAAEADVDGAVQYLQAAAAMHEEQVPIPLERGRTLLALGVVLRRRKQRRIARETLAEALTIFESIGSPVWADRVRSELARVSGRAPGDGELTMTERRVAELVARGLTNREIAAELVVTVRAVESTLTKVYAKLGVRSRTQLTGLLHDPAPH
jgi:DNA-binding NarL/FixJ family response regulator